MSSSNVGKMAHWKGKVGLIVKAAGEFYTVIDNETKRQFMVKHSDPDLVIRATLGQMINVRGDIRAMIDEYVNSSPTARPKAGEVVTWLQAKGVSQLDAEEAVYQYMTHGKAITKGFVESTWNKLSTDARASVLDAMDYRGDQEEVSYLNFHELPQEVQNVLQQAGLNENFLRSEGFLKAQDENNKEAVQDADLTEEKKGVADYWDNMSPEERQQIIEQIEDRTGNAGQMSSAVHMPYNKMPSWLRQHIDMQVQNVHSYSKRPDLTESHNNLVGQGAELLRGFAMEWNDENAKKVKDAIDDQTKGLGEALTDVAVHVGNQALGAPVLTKKPVAPKVRKPRNMSFVNDIPKVTSTNEELHFTKDGMTSNSAGASNPTSKPVSRTHCEECGYEGKNLMDLMEHVLSHK